MDGVPFVTQIRSRPGKSFRYDFPLKQSGTYWMHSHYGLQEQLYNSAPLIIWTPEERAKSRPPGCRNAPRTFHSRRPEQSEGA